MKLLYDRDNVLVYAGHGLARAEVLASARKQLVGAGADVDDVDEALIDRQGLIGRAHWAGEKVGFCGPQHPQAVAVTVVNLPSGFTGGSDAKL